MPSKPVFPIRDLFREMELRFCRSRSLPTPDHLGYYLTFLLLDHPLDETWMILLDTKHRIVDSVQCTEGILAIENMHTVQSMRDKRVRYFCLAHTHSAYSTKPSDQDKITHYNVSTYFAKNPEYIGCYVLNQSLDYCYLPPNIINHKE